MPRVLSCLYEFSGRCIERSGLLDLEFTHHRPEEADELTSHGDDGDLRRFPVSDAVEELVESVLGLPGMSDHLGRLAPLSSLERLAHRRSVPIVPGGLDEGMAAAAVAGLGDGPSVLSFS